MKYYTIIGIPGGYSEIESENGQWVKRSDLPGEQSKPKCKRCDSTDLTKWVSVEGNFNRCNFCRNKQEI